MKGNLCYTTRDNAKVTLQRAVVFFLVSTYTHQPCIHKYFDFHAWWTVVAWYFKYQVKSEQLLKKLATLALFSVKSRMTVDEPRIAEVHLLLNHSME